jgi:hypothetical protein
MTPLDRIEALTVSVGYGDFLAVSAEENRGLFDRHLVVTTPDDAETREVARRWGLELLLVEEATRDGKFDKGHLIRRAQRMLAADSWRLHTDADIVYPRHFRDALRVADLDPACIYGFDRVMVKSWQQWKDLRDSGYLAHQWDYHCRVKFPKGVEVGSRWAASDFGYCPIGWGQLWHGAADEHVSFQHRAYPRYHGAASRTDTQMPLQFDRRKRVMVPEVIAVHLESEEREMGANWNGRTSRRFEAPGPAAPPATKVPEPPRTVSPS